MHRASKAQFSIPEQQHYVCDDVAHGGGPRISIKENSCKVTRKGVDEFAPLRTVQGSIRHS